MQQPATDNPNQRFKISSLDSFGVIQINGQDAQKFLQGQLTVNVESLSQNELILAATCNPQGRILSLFFITKKADVIYLILKKEMIESTISHFKKYAVFFKVEISDKSSQFSVYGGNQAINGELNHDIKINFNQQPVTWLDKDISLFLVDESDKAFFESKLTDLLTLSEQSWLSYLAKSGISWLETKSQAEFLPHNLNLPSLKAVDFKKGCFTGQEVIARMHYKGKLKSHLQLFQLEANDKNSHEDSNKDNITEISPLSAIFNEETKVAEVVCSAKDENNYYFILALIKDSYLESKIFHLNSENGPILKIITNH